MVLTEGRVVGWGLDRTWGIGEMLMRYNRKVNLANLEGIHISRARWVIVSRCMASPGMEYYFGN